MNPLSRRSFLRVAGTGLLLPSALTGWSPIRKAYAQEQTRYNGTFWLTIHAGGGWDPTLICDPKGRVSETEVAPVNTYFIDEILEIGNFLVPPVEVWLIFSQSFKTICWSSTALMSVQMDMSKACATWSGHTDPNRPSFSALVAGETTPPSLAFISNGGYDTQVDWSLSRLPNPTQYRSWHFQNALIQLIQIPISYRHLLWIRSMLRDKAEWRDCKVKFTYLEH